MNGQLVELLRGDSVVMNVRTGELVDIRNSTFEDVAQTREGLAALKREIDEASVLLDAELAARIDTAIRAGQIDKYTVRVGDYEVKVPSPEAGGEVDAHALRQDLIARSNAGAIDLERSAIDGAFKTKTTYTLNRSVYNTLAKQEPELEALLKRHTGPPSRRRATVTAIASQPRPVPVAAVAEGETIGSEEEFPW
jgi:hypothetical protein